MAYSLQKEKLAELLPDHANENLTIASSANYSNRLLKDIFATGVTTEFLTYPRPSIQNVVDTLHVIEGDVVAHGDQLHSVTTSLQSVRMLLQRCAYPISVAAGPVQRESIRKILDHMGQVLEFSSLLRLETADALNSVTSAAAQEN